MVISMIEAPTKVSEFCNFSQPEFILTQMRCFWPTKTLLPPASRCEHLA